MMMQASLRAANLRCAYHRRAVATAAAPTMQLVPPQPAKSAARPEPAVAPALQATATDQDAPFDAEMERRVRIAMRQLMQHHFHTERVNLLREYSKRTPRSGSTGGMLASPTFFPTAEVKTIAMEDISPQPTDAPQRLVFSILPTGLTSTDADAEAAAASFDSVGAAVTYESRKENAAAELDD
jgi:hypothetical protein